MFRVVKFYSQHRIVFLMDDSLVLFLEHVVNRCPAIFDTAPASGAVLQLFVSTSGAVDWSEDQGESHSEAEECDLSISDTIQACHPRHWLGSFAGRDGCRVLDKGHESCQSSTPKTIPYGVLPNSAPGQPNCFAGADGFWQIHPLAGTLVAVTRGSRLPAASGFGRPSETNTWKRHASAGFACCVCLQALAATIWSSQGGHCGAVFHVEIFRSQPLGSWSTDDVHMIEISYSKQLRHGFSCLKDPWFDHVWSLKLTSAAEGTKNPPALLPAVLHKKRKSWGEQIWKGLTSDNSKILKVTTCTRWTEHNRTMSTKILMDEWFLKQSLRRIYTKNMVITSAAVRSAWWYLDKNKVPRQGKENQEPAS